VTGDEVQVAFTKYDGSPHWHIGTRHLGDDEHGTWLHSPAGTLTWRPGLAFTYDRANVLCVPRDQHWAATLYDGGGAAAVTTYVDITTPAVWSAGRVTMSDLDLDVVQRVGQEPFVDDEDEFELHRVRYAYPPALQAAARAASTSVLAAVTQRRAPFDGATAARWLARADPAWAPVAPPAQPAA
jgi:uncharacterized protein